MSVNGGPNINPTAYSGNAKYNELTDEQLMQQRDENGGANIKNSTVGEGENAVKTFSVFASADFNQKDGVDCSEAQKGFSDIFSEANKKLNQDNLIQNAIDSSSRLSQDSKNGAFDVVKKYLGGTSIAGLLNNWSGFTNVTYDVVQVNNTYEATGIKGGSQDAKGVQAQIDELVEAKVKSQVENLTSKIETQYNDALNKALAQAENQLVGDADIVGQFNPSTKNKKGISSEDFAKIQYERSSNDGENTNVTTYESSRGAENASAGYNTTVSYLMANGAKQDTRLVNGQKQAVYEVKVNGQKQWVTVDDAGQVHTLDKDGGFLRQDKFTTDDSIADAQYQANNDGIDGNDFDPSTARNVKVKVRNVDGQNQSVMTWKDANGQKHSRVIDYNEHTGLTSSGDVHQVNAAGTRAKYSSETSGLGAWVAADDGGTNIRQFNDKNHMVQDAVHDNGDGTTTAGHVRTNRGRMKIDAQWINTAVFNMNGAVTRAGGQVKEIKKEVQNNSMHIVTEFTINGHTYTVDNAKPKEADRTMRLIQAELNAIKGRDNGVEETPEVPTEPTIDTSNIKFDDKRVSAGSWGVDSETLQSNSTEINKISYDSGLSRPQFASQGWKASAGRTEEKAVIELMNNYMEPAATEGANPTVTNDVTGISTAKDFATRFLKVALSGDTKFVKSGIAGKSLNNFNIGKLANAIKTANPSFFDADGNMFKDCDFNRINLPRKLDDYLNQ